MPRPVVPIRRDAEEPLGHLVEGAVVGRDDVRVRADDELGGVDAPGLEPVDLLEQHGEVDDDAVADHRRTRGREDPAREQVQRIFLGGLPRPDDDRVTGVVAAVELDDVVDSCRRAGRSPCPCPRRPTGRPPAPRPASAHLLEPVRTASVDGRARSEAIRCAPDGPTAAGLFPNPGMRRVPCRHRLPVAAASQPTGPDRLGSELEPRLGAELVHEAGHPAAHGAQAPAEVPRDGLVLEAAAQQVEQVLVLALVRPSPGGDG